LKLFLCIKNNEYNFKPKHNQIIKSRIIDGKQYKVWEKEHTFVDCKKPSEMNCYNKPPKRQNLMKVRLLTINIISNLVLNIVFL